MRDHLTARLTGLLFLSTDVAAWLLELKKESASKTTTIITQS